MIITEQLTINEKQFTKTYAFNLKPEYLNWTQEKILTAIAESDNIKSEYYQFNIDNIIEKRFYIERDGVQYSEAIDPSEFGRTYTETDIPVEAEPIDPEEGVVNNDE